MIRMSILLPLVFLVCLLTATSFAVGSGKAIGSITLDNQATLLGYAATATVENLFDEKKKDLIVVLTDKPLGSTPPDDELSLVKRAERGDIVLLMLRIDGKKLVNAKVSHKGLEGVQILPAGWFQFTLTGKTEGSIKLARKEVDGHFYACSVDFNGVEVVKSPDVAKSSVDKVDKPAPEAHLTPATSSNIDAKSLTALLVKAMMEKNEHMAVELIKQGADPNARDQYGTAMLSWAVMMCLPKVVQTLIDKKADLKVERAPGLTILKEAGACPEALKILKAAGAK